MKKIILSFAIVFLSAFVLVACGDNKNPDKPGVEDPKEFVWEGLEQRNVVRGDQVDLLDGVTVKQGDVDLTDKIIVLDDGGFTTHLADVYDVEFKVDGTDEVKTKKFAVSIGHNFGNGDFSMKQYNWSVDKPGGQFETEYKDNQANVTITNAGTSWWSLQLYQRNISFTEGVTYKLTLRAKSSTGKSISVGYEDANNGFAMLNPGTQTIKLEEDFTNYVMYYTANSNLADLKAVIYLGHQFTDDFLREGETHEVVIDNINIEVVNRDTSITFEGVEDVSVISSADNNIDVLEGVTVKQGETDITGAVKVLGELPTTVRSNASFYVTYVIELECGTVAFATKRFRYQLGKNNPFEVVNGDFSEGLVGWEQDVNQTDGTGKATFFENGDGTVSIKVEDPSSAGWHIQLQQSGAQLKAGKTYKVKLVVKASAARDVELEIVNPGKGFAPLTPNTTIALTEEWQTIEVEFSIDEDVNAKVGLLLGKIGNTAKDITVTVDELQVYEVTEEAKLLNDLSENLTIITGFNRKNNF